MANPVLGVRCSPELKARIEALAAERGVSVSAVVVPALEKAFAANVVAEPAAADPLLFRRALPTRR